MNQRLRTAHIIGTFPPYRGGTGNLVWNETRELARRGHDVHVFTSAQTSSASAAEGVRVHYTRPMLRFGNASVVPGLLGRLRGFDLLHLYVPFFSSEVVWAASRLFHVPLVVTYVHDVELGGLAGLLTTVYQRSIGRRVLLDADRLLFLSLDYARSSLAADLVERANVRAHSPGVDTERFHPARDVDAVRRAFGISPNDVLLLFVGGLDRPHYFKGVGVLLESLQRLRRPDLQLLVVGDGDLRAAYEKQVQERALMDQVTFACALSDDELPRAYGAADILVFPSTTRAEAFGLVLLEAMACGIPVIASRLPGVRSVVEDTGGGVLVSPRDVTDLARAISALADDAEQRRRLGAQGRRAVELAYTWRTVGQRLEEIYFDLLGLAPDMRRATGLSASN